ncbi:MAG: CopG family transcriptional regulator [Nocardioides sp.]
MNLDPDIVAAVDRLRREEGLGLSEAVNALARRGARPAGRPDYVFSPVTSDLGLTLDVTDTARALELLDDLDAESR